MKKQKNVRDVDRVEVSTFLARPDRAPIEIPNLTSKYYDGKVVAEIGCAAGDFLPLSAQGARKVVGYESDRQRFSMASTRPEVKEDKSIRVSDDLVTPESIVDADFYYGWSTEPSVVEFAERLKKENKGSFL